MEILEEHKMVSLELIEPNPKNGYRKNDEIAKALSIDIEKRGRLLVDAVLTPRNDKPGHYYYISGHQRGKAFLLLKRTEISASIVKFDSEEEEKDAIRGFNKGRIKCEWDKAWEFAEERDKLDRKKGIRSDLTGEATGKTVDIIAAEYPMKISGDQVGKYLRIYDNRPGLYDFIDNVKKYWSSLTIGGADNVITFLKERNALDLKDWEMMREVVRFIDGKLPEAKDLESAFFKAVPKLEKALKESKKPKENSGIEPPIVKKTKKAVSKLGKKLTEENTNGNAIAPSARHDVQPSKKHSLPLNDKGAPESAPNTKNGDITGAEGNTREPNANETFAEATKDAEDKKMGVENVVVAEKENSQATISTGTSDDSQKQEPSSIKDSPVEPQLLYVKDSNGNFVEYTCTHDGCPFRNCKI